VDADPRVVIFEQTEAGMYIRMALLKLACSVDRSRGWAGR
jgi:aspartate carbamoyltransferase catalytic subunit